VEYREWEELQMDWDLVFEMNIWTRAVPGGRNETKKWFAYSMLEYPGTPESVKIDLPTPATSSEYVEQWLRPRAEQGVVTYMQTLGCWYAYRHSYGISPAERFGEARPWWTRVANSQNEWAGVACCCLWSAGYVDWRRATVESGNEDIDEARSHAENEIERWLRRGTLIGDPDSTWNYALFLRDFRGGTDTDPYIRELIKRAARAGNREAQSTSLPPLSGLRRWLHKRGA
jgi:hypothetical protein